MVSPSGRVPKQDPDWFLVATEACGGGTPDLGSVLEVLGFIGSVGIGNKSRGPMRRRQGCPPPSWWPQDSFGPSPMLCGLLLVKK